MDEALFQRLCQAYIEGTATREEQEQFAALLNSSESARTSYVEQMRIHAMLIWQHGRSAAFAPEIREEHKIIPFPRWRRTAMAAAAALLILSTLAVWWWIARNAKPGVSFEVVSASDVPFHAGDRVTRRMIELTRGKFSFRLTSGAMVEVAGPAKVELVSPMHLRVLRGMLTADISHGQKGFVVDTEQTHVVDLGTRFSVSAEQKAGTDVVVFDGKVEVFGPSGKATTQQPKITLIEGEAIRVDHDRQSRRLRMVSLGPDGQSLDSIAQNGVVKGVTDNVSEEGFWRYYGLVREAMGEGARVYTTGHHRTWHALPGQTFPHELEGADGICTFDTDRHIPDLQITLKVSQPCDLYVMTDARFSAPGWLRAEFQDTGYHLRSGPWIPRGTPADQNERFYKDEKAYIPYVVWRKRITEAGPVTLGSPLGANQRGTPVMYSLAVKAL
jgi:ferric-dicitrate binding protein FerR (iron transport regulator)